jgi:tRNA(adenine34) deaminase
MSDENKYMLQAIGAARQAATMNEVPVGAVLVEAATGMVIASTGNRTVQDNDPTAHAEMLVLQAGGKHFGAQRMPECDLYVTLEPCPMCATAISFARIRRLYFGAYDPKGGGVEHGPRIYSHATCHHKPEVYGGLHEQECGQVLKDFFKDKR